MTRSTLSRLTRLERSGSDRGAFLVVASSHEEAVIHAQHSGALVIVTGVKRTGTERPT
jgi:hypothetical protein